MKIELKNSLSRSRKGFALLIIMFVLGVSMMTLGSFMYRTQVMADLNHRNNQFRRNMSAAEGATEKVLASMIRDFKVSGPTSVDNRLNDYKLMVPDLNDSGVWTNFVVYDAQGLSGHIDVTKTQSAVYKPLSSKFSGLSGYVSTYEVRAFATEPLSLHPDLKAGVLQEIELTQIPAFQFAIFYNKLMEYTYTADFTINGRVHGNADIYTGSIEDLTFNGDVTSVGMNEEKAWLGFSLSQFTGTVSFGAKKETGAAALNVPISPDASSEGVREIIEMPPPGENPQSWKGQQRMYNKAELVVRVTDAGPMVMVKNSLDEYATQIPEEQVEAFIDTSVTFTDQREGKMVKATEIDISQFISWASTNTYVISKLGGGNPPNIMYVSDERTVTSSQLPAVRLVNGEQLPSRGLTIATRNPLYVKGNYNQPDPSKLNTTDTSNTKPAALISDALTVLSSNWDDSKSHINFRARPAAPTTINAAVMTGNVETAPGATPLNGYSGGVGNLTRLLEDWNAGGSRKRLTMNGSIIAMFESEIATQQFRWPGYYYFAPERDFNLDPNFSTEGGLPPGTPQVISVVRKSWTQAVSH